MTFEEMEDARELTHCPPAAKVGKDWPCGEGHERACADKAGDDKDEGRAAAPMDATQSAAKAEDDHERKQETKPLALPMNAAAGPPAAPPAGPHTAGGGCATQSAAKAEDDHERKQETKPPALPMNAAAGPRGGADLATRPRKLTKKELAARKRNGRLGGPKTAGGKALTRLNARKHGVFATALTGLDHRELRSILDEFAEAARPEGALEEALVEKIALCWLRLQRCARAEAQLHTEAWVPATSSPTSSNASCPSCTATTRA